MAKLNIGTKMFLSTGALMLMAALLGVTAYLGLASTGDRLNVALGSGFKKEMLAARIDINHNINHNVIDGFTELLG